MSGLDLDGWLIWMQAMAWQVTVLTALIVVADRLLRGRVSAQLRHGLWSLIVLKLVLPPSLPAWWRAEQVVGGEAETLASAPSLLGPAQLGPVLLGPSLFGLWLVGASALGAAALLRRRRMRAHLLACSEPAPEALVAVAARVAERLDPPAPPPAPRAHRASGRLVSWLRACWRRVSRNSPHGRLPTLCLPTLCLPTLCLPTLRIGDVGGPLVLGCWRPVIILPASSVGTDGEAWSTVDLEHALAHEIAHVRRGDLWSEALFAALTVLYWFHPAIHLAQRRAHDLRELCCDATVASRLGPGYRRSLVRLAAQALLPHEHAGAVPFVGSGSRIMARLEALERARVTTRRHRLRVLAAVSLSALIALPMAPRVRSRTADDALAEARALAEQMVTTRQSDPANTGSMHVRWAVMQLNQQESARQASGSKEQ